MVVLSTCAHKNIVYNMRVDPRLHHSEVCISATGRPGKCQKDPEGIRRLNWTSTEFSSPKSPPYPKGPSTQ